MRGERSRRHHRAAHEVDDADNRRRVIDNYRHVAVRGVGVYLHFQLSIVNIIDSENLDIVGGDDCVACDDKLAMGAVGRTRRMHDFIDTVITADNRPVAAIGDMPAKEPVVEGLEPRHADRQCAVVHYRV